MKAGEEIAASVAALLGEQPEWRQRVSHRPGTSVVSVDTDLDGALLELRPDPSVEEVPAWVTLDHGPADLSEIEFEPVSVAVVHWGPGHSERGLIAGFPQMLLGPALAGTTRRTPVAGGRRVDGRLELWIEPTATGEVLAAVDADSGLGTVAELRWRTGPDSGRLLVALAATGQGRNVGVARLPVNPTRPLEELDLLVHPDLGGLAVDAALISLSLAAAYSQTARDHWRKLLP
jgi:hypothetical protein